MPLPRDPGDTPRRAPEQRTAKLFRNGRNQAVRLPQEFRFRDTDEVMIYREGSRLILEPKRKSWLSLADLPAADQDFMQERPELLPERRVKF